MAKSPKPESAAKRGLRHLRASGYKKAAGGDIHGKVVARKSGGMVPGEEASERPDRRSRSMVSIDQPDDAQGNDQAKSYLARGGDVPKKGGGKTTININVGAPAGAGPGGPPGGGLPGGPPPPPPMMPHPPMAGPPPGMPPGGPPGLPPGGPPGMPPHPPMGAPPGGPPMMPHRNGGRV